jgi:hypothetical protein
VTDSLGQQRHDGEAFLGNRAEPPPDDEPDPRRDGRRLVAENLLDPAERFLAPVLDGAEEQIFLVLEVMVDGALRDAGRLADILEPGVALAALGEDRERGIENLVRSLVGPPLPAQHSGGHASPGSSITYSQV